MFSVDKARSLDLEFTLPVDIAAQSTFEATIGSIPVKRLYMKGQTTSAFFSFLEKSIPRLDINLGEAHLAIYRNKLDFRIRLHEDEVIVELGSPEKPHENPFSGIALARFTSDLNYFLGAVNASLPRKGDPVKVKGTIRLIRDISSPNLDGLFKIHLESNDFKKGRFNGVTFKFDDTMFDSPTGYEINLYVDEKDFRARIEFESSLAGPIDLGALCDNLVSWGNRAHTILVAK